MAYCIRSKRKGDSEEDFYSVVVSQSSVNEDPTRGIVQVRILLIEMSNLI